MKLFSYATIIISEIKMLVNGTADVTYDLTHGIMNANSEAEVKGILFDQLKQKHPSKKVDIEVVEVDLADMLEKLKESL